MLHSARVWRIPMFVASLLRAPEGNAFSAWHYGPWMCALLATTGRYTKAEGDPAPKKGCKDDMLDSEPDLASDSDAGSSS